MKIAIWQGDITALKVDAIVNAANTSLLSGGGVDGAIHKAAGAQLLEACKKFRGCASGQARITPGFHLSARYIIHTPGPIWRGGDYDEEAILSLCYQNSLSLAQEYACDSIAFPAISTGVYRFPLLLATQIAIHAIQDYCVQHQYHPQIILVAFKPNTLKMYYQILQSNDIKFVNLDDKNN